MNHVDSRAMSYGFTIVELMMAMAFISVLLLTVAMTVIQIGTIYNKGMTMRAVDDAGRTISDNVRQTFAASQTFVIDQTSFRQWRDPNSNPTDPYDGGRLCTGSYSYLWNSGQGLARDRGVNSYESGDKNIRFVKVRDSGSQFCSDLRRQIKPQDDPVELLSGGSGALAVQSFDVSVAASDPSIGQALYHVVTVIGTNDRDALTTGSGTLSCLGSSDTNSSQDFCTVNTFDFTAQAGYKGGNS